MKLLRAIRLPNLFIVALSQVIFKYVLINPYYIDSETSVFSDFHFILLVLATLALTTFGYLINDYFDFELDEKSGHKVKSGLSKQALLVWSMIAIALGFGLSLLISIQTGLLHLLWIYPFAASLLLVYSKTLKSRGLPGNILVALFTAAVMYIVILAEQHIALEDHAYIQSVLYSFMIFAFLINFYREIIKDIEDIDADQDFGLSTLPITIGPVKAGITAFFIGILVLILIVLFAMTLTENRIQQMYVLGLLALPMTYILYLNHHADVADDYHRISQMVKGIMLFGLVYLFIV